MSELKFVVSKLSRLTPAERKAVRQALDFLDGTKSKTVAVQQPVTNDWLTPGILSELRRRGMSYPAMTEKRLNGLAPNYVADSAAIMTDLRQRLKQAKEGNSEARLDYAELLDFGRTTARALADYLQPSVSLGLKTMLNNVSKVPDALQASYPDYLACGMLWVLVGTKPQTGKTETHGKVESSHRR